MARRPKRPQTTQEAEDAIRRSIARDRYASSVNARVFVLLRDLENDIAAKLSALDPDAVNKRKRLEQLKRETANEIARRYDLINKEATGELPELAVNEARWKEKSLQNTIDATGANITIALAPTATLEALIDQPIVLGGVAAAFWKAEGERLSTTFSQQMQLGISGGENLGQLIQRVRGTRALGYNDGIMEVSRRNAESLVRTSVNSVANAAHLAVFKQNEDIVEGVQHVSVLDNRTTLICAGRANLIWRLDTFAPVGHSTPYQAPPLHWRCRSILASVLDLENPPPALTFESWFNGMSPNEQNKTFGVGRAALFREGRITQKDLLSSKGDPLTLKQLTAEHGPTVGAPTPSLKDRLLSNWNSVTMEDVLTNPSFVYAERAALSAPVTLANDEDIPDAFFDKRKYARTTGPNFKPDPNQPFDVEFDDALATIRKRGESFAGPDGPLYERRATIILGPPAAGKSTLAEAISGGTRSAIIDVDEAKAFAKEFNNGLGANAVHNESVALTRAAFKDAYDEGLNVILPKVGASEKSIQKTIDELRSKGYTVDLVNLAVSQDEAARRMGMRFENTGRLIPSEFYRSIGDKPTTTFHTLKRADGVNSYAEVNADGPQGTEKLTEGTGSIAEYLARIYGL